MNTIIFPYVLNFSDKDITYDAFIKSKYLNCFGLNFCMFDELYIHVLLNRKLKIVIYSTFNECRYITYFCIFKQGAGSNLEEAGTQSHIQDPYGHPVPGRKTKTYKMKIGRYQ